MSDASFAMPLATGTIYLRASEKGIKELYWQNASGPFLSSLKGESPEVKILARAVKQLKEYFSGKRTQFDLPLDVAGTEFQMRVWAELQKIPFGKTTSYGDLARKLGKEKAFRAVGTANGKNPVSIIVPCHRVIAADGALGGYSGGLGVKKRLLELERSWPAQLSL
jgi:methylated-DNA-[protein]-cysteine S-methyltransferase